MQVNVRVTTMDAELEFAIQPNTTGKQLFDQVGTHVETCISQPSPIPFISLYTLLTVTDSAAELPPPYTTDKQVGSQLWKSVLPNRT